MVSPVDGGNVRRTKGAGAVESEPELRRLTFRNGLAETEWIVGAADAILLKTRIANIRHRSTSTQRFSDQD